MRSPVAGSISAIAGEAEFRNEGVLNLRRVRRRRQIDMGKVEGEKETAEALMKVCAISQHSSCQPEVG